MAAGDVTISGSYTIADSTSIANTAGDIANLNTGWAMVLPDANTGKFKIMFVEGA